MQVSLAPVSLSLPTPAHPKPSLNPGDVIPVPHVSYLALYNYIRVPSVRHRAGPQELLGKQYILTGAHQARTEGQAGGETVHGSPRAEQSASQRKGLMSTYVSVGVDCVSLCMLVWLCGE